MERIGRAKEKYKKIAQYYAVAVEESKGVATKVSWEYTKQDESDRRFSGGYFLRTDRTDLEESELWKIYSMLLDLEDAFRTLKSELGLRPNYHQKEDRADSHIFISLLAYHVLHSIRTHLKEKGIRYRWESIRMRMATHTRDTTGLKSKEGKMIYLRKWLKPEPFHKIIYDALGVDPTICKEKKFNI